MAEIRVGVALPAPAELSHNAACAGRATGEVAPGFLPGGPSPCAPHLGCQACEQRRKSGCAVERLQSEGCTVRLVRLCAGRCRRAVPPAGATTTECRQDGGTVMRDYGSCMHLMPGLSPAELSQRTRIKYLHGCAMHL